MIRGDIGLIQLTQRQPVLILFWPYLSSMYIYFIDFDNKIYNDTPTLNMKE